MEICAFYLDVKIQELLDLRAHKCFWNASLLLNWVALWHQRQLQWRPFIARFIIANIL